MVSIHFGRDVYISRKKTKGAKNGDLVAVKIYFWGDEDPEKGQPKANIWQGKFPYLNLATDKFKGAAPVKSFVPNKFGLYDMAGNVAEWTSSAYVSSTNTMVSDMNPNFQYNAKNDDADVLKRKVIKGGSWKDIAYYLQCGVRTYEYQYESRPYVGFRCVRSFNGE